MEEINSTCSTCPQCQQDICTVLCPDEPKPKPDYYCADHARMSCNYHCPDCKSCTQCFVMCDGCDNCVCTYCSFKDKKVEFKKYECKFECEGDGCYNNYCYNCSKKHFVIDEEMCFKHSVESSSKYQTLIKLYLETFLIDKISKDVVNIICEYYLRLLV